MPITERLEKATDALRWEDKIPFHYEYTAGVAGDRFLRGVMKGRIVAGYCNSCKKASLPARIYCVECYGPIRRFVRVEQPGRVKAITRTGASGDVFGYVVFPRVRGGIVHRLIGDAEAGDRVFPRFKPRRERVGAVSDLLGFEKAR